MLRPISRSLMVIDLRMPSGLMMNAPLRAIPFSGIRTPYCALTSFVMSLRSG